MNNTEMQVIEGYLKRPIAPLNTSGRSKESIVSDAESTWLARFVIGSVQTECVEGCRCYNCFQKALDVLVAKSECNIAPIDSALDSTLDPVYID